MNKLKISQIQFEAMSTPSLNAKLLKKYLNKSIKFKPDLILYPRMPTILLQMKKKHFI
jgi:hypothetical protein